MNLHVLVTATNEVLASKTPTAGELWKVCVIGCKTLRMLADDKEFFDQIKAAATAGTLSPDIRQTFSDIKQFDAFLESEKKSFINVGVNQESASFLIKQAQAVRQEMQNWVADPEAIRIGINKLRNETCNMADELEKVVEVGGARRLLRKLVFGIGGAAIVGINSAAVVAMGQAYATASVLVGGKLIDLAIRQERK